jgi:hypothetical protein
MVYVLATCMGGFFIPKEGLDSAEKGRKLDRA